MTLDRALRVRDVMTKRPVVFTSEMRVLDAATQLVDRRISGAPVVDDRGNLVGILTERDFLKAVIQSAYHDEGVGRVADFMTRDVETVHVDDGVVDVSLRLVNSGFRRFPVLEDNRVVGLIARRDVLRAVIGVLQG